MRTLALLLLTLAAGCAANRDDRHSPLAAAQRVLAIDFGPQALDTRFAGLQRAPEALASELRRAPNLTAHLPGLRPELDRFAAAHHRIGSLLQNEAVRRPTPRQPLALLPQRWVQGIVDAVANVPFVLGLHRRPLGENSDRQHRTDPIDQRPEAGLGARLARRLGLVH